MPRLLLALLLVLVMLPRSAIWGAGAPGKTPSLPLKAPTAQAHDGCIIDSRMTLTEAIGNPRVPASLARQLTLVTVRYYAPDGKLHQGQLVCNRQVAGDLAAIFKEIQRSKFPIASVIPVARYHNSDTRSMAANNTSCFNYRYVPGTHRWSLHAAGRAIDINPMLNPYLDRGKTSSVGARYHPHILGTIVLSSPIYRAFTRRGWCWGGRWKLGKDYQHFQKG